MSINSYYLHSCGIRASLGEFIAFGRDRLSCALKVLNEMDTICRLTSVGSLLPSSDWVDGVLREIRSLIDTKENAIFEPLLALLSTLYGDCDQEDLTEAFLKYPMKDHLSYMVWLSDGGSSSDPEWGEKRILENPRVILQALGKLSPSSLGCIDRKICEIFQKNEAMAFEKILCSLSTLPQDRINYVFECACRNNQLEVVSFLCSSSIEISQECIDRSAVLAAWNNNIDVMQLLLKDHARIKESLLQRALENASLRGHKEMVKLILSKTDPLKEEILFDALTSAAKSKRLAILEILVQFCPRLFIHLLQDDELSISNREFIKHLVPIYLSFNELNTFEVEPLKDIVSTILDIRIPSLKIELLSFLDKLLIEDKESFLGNISWGCVEKTDLKLSLCDLK